jgi:hypothetical protein
MMEHHHSDALATKTTHYTVAGYPLVTTLVLVTTIWVTVDIGEGERC